MYIYIINNMASNIGCMVWNQHQTYGSKTYSGLDIDIVKSAVQKYIRRNLPQKAILSAIELYRMNELGATPIVSNLFNRIAIIAAEDVGPANLPLILEVIRTIESKDKDLYQLLAMIQLLAESKKTRLMDQAWYAYATPHGRIKSQNKNIALDTTFTSEDVQYITEHMNEDIFHPEDPHNLRSYILIFMKRLLASDYNAYTWAYFFLDQCTDTLITRRKKFILNNRTNTTGKPDILLWKALSKVLPPETHDILVEAYYNHTESLPFLQVAVLIALYKLPYEKYNLESAVTIWKTQQKDIVTDMLHGTYQLQVDEYVIDKHTALGRKNGKNINDFLTTGAVVIPQDEKYYNETLEKIYTQK